MAASVNSSTFKWLQVRRGRWCGRSYKLRVRFQTILRSWSLTREASEDLFLDGCSGRRQVEGPRELSREASEDTCSQEGTGILFDAD
jgi:hypothetical protein